MEEAAPTTSAAPRTRNRRYVIQRHRYGGFDHYDFMFQVPNSEMLRTFQLPDEPGAARCRAGLTCREIAPHRPDYLDYEGAVSGNRGSVEIWDRGTIQVVKERARLLEFRLLSERGQEHATWIFHFTGGAGWHLMSPNAGGDGAFQSEERPAENESAP